MSRFGVPEMVVVVLAATLALPAAALAQPGAGTVPIGRIFGHVHVDHDHDGVADPGEEAAGRSVVVRERNASGPTVVTTDDDGFFAVERLWYGNYAVGVLGEPHREWFPQVEVYVHGTGGPNSNVRVDLLGMPPLDDVVRPQLTFDRGVVAPGEETTVELTLENLTDGPVAGVHATCGTWGPAVLGSENWPGLGPDEPGLTLAPGESRVVELPVRVTDTADQWGYAEADCAVGAPGDGNGPRAVARTRAPGVVVDVPVDVHHDPDGVGPLPPQQPDGVGIALVDQIDGRVRTARSAGGLARFDALPAGLYEVRVFGAWRNADDSVGWRRPIGTCGECARSIRMDVEPGPDDPGPEPTPLGALSGTVYGDADHDGVAEPGEEIAGASVDVYAPNGPRIVVVTGPDGRFTAPDLPYGVYVIRAVVPGHHPPQPTHRDVDATTPHPDVPILATPLPPPGTGTITGVVYGDADEDGVLDPGEELAGVHVTVRWERDMPSLLVTDATGRFELPDSRHGRYSVDAGGSDQQWVFPAFEQVRLDEDTPELHFDLRGRPPTEGRLTAALALDRESYVPGDAVGVAATLTNTTDRPVPDVNVGCIERANDELWRVRDVVWEDAALARPGRGITLAPGETRVVRGAGRVPPTADQRGETSLWCHFGLPHGAGAVLAEPAVARVPGVVVDELRFVAVQEASDLLADRAGPTAPTAGVGFALFDGFDDRLVAKGRTGADGSATLADIPAGPYRLLVYGPWALVSPDENEVLVGTCPDCSSDTVTRRVASGPEVPEPRFAQPPPPQHGPSPPPGGSAPPGDGRLASTGVDLLGLAAGGVLALVLGSSAVGSAPVRRRRGA